MTPQEQKQYLKTLSSKLVTCRKLQHGELVSDEEFQAVCETANSPERPIDSGGGEVIAETQIA